ncbi:MAG: potassium/proton antiporter [Methanobrevibacter sp.]|jgi:cell volume regulation protein A|nr:potassium/proton antiporter [Candidatus Methanovirga meridionalis]
MALEFYHLLLLAGSILISSVILTKASSLIGIPSLIVFVIVGMLLGSDGIVGIYFNDYGLVKNISTIALIIIIFEGGLNTNIIKAKKVAYRGITLSTIGVFITAITVGLFTHFFLGMDLIVSLLLGSIISSTDSAAVYSILSPLNVKFKNKLDILLEFESATNDPMAYVLTTSFIYMVLHPTTSIFLMIIIFLKSLILGVVIGYIIGKLSTILIDNINLISKGLYPVLMIGIAILSFAIAEFVGGNGFLAVYISSILIGSSALSDEDKNLTFFYGLAWLMQIAMFIILGLLSFPRQILSVIGFGLLISIVLVFIARPLAIFTCLIKSNFNFKDKIFLSWVGIKGAVPIIFATYPLSYGIIGADFIFNVVFFISIISVLIQGSTIKILAKKLNLIEKI